MATKNYNTLLAFCLFFMAHWFFGNLYEEIVLVPNQLTNSYNAIKSWRGYFTITNQLYYYVPFTQAAVIVICFLFFKVNDKVQKDHLKKASIFGILALLLTGLIVTQINLKIFVGGDVENYKTEVFQLSVIWLVSNAVRLFLVGSALYHILRTYTLRQSMPA